MRAVIKKLLFLVSAFLIALGFNTLDCMINTFYWEPWREWFPNGMWAMVPSDTPFFGSFNLNWWICYVFFGILPLSSGCLMLGYLLGAMKGG